MMISAARSRLRRLEIVCSRRIAIDPTLGSEAVECPALSPPRVPAIARLVVADEGTIRDVIHASFDQGLAMLAPQQAPGSRRITDADVQVVVATVRTRPARARQHHHLRSREPRGSIRTPFKRHRYRPKLSARQKAVNRSHARIRTRGERANATLKTWKVLAKLMLLSPPSHPDRAGRPRPTPRREPDLPRMKKAQS